TEEVQFVVYHHQGIQYSAFDFPGQLEHHATNAFFLSSGNAIVLLCVQLARFHSAEARLEQLRVWLSALHAHQKRFHVVFVGTYADEAKEEKRQTPIAPHHYGAEQWTLTETD